MKALHSMKFRNLDHKNENQRNTLYLGKTPNGAQSASHMFWSIIKKLSVAQWAA